MITVSKDQLQKVEYLLNQSAQGNHILFDQKIVRHVFTTPTAPMTEEQAYEVEHLIEKIISLDGLQAQRAYLDQLPQETLFRVVKTYFNIVENNLYENNQLRH